MRYREAVVITKSMGDAAGPIIADIDGIELSQVDKDVIMHPKLGGLILFSRNFESVEQLRDLVTTISELRPSLLITVDHEGGRVQRFRDGFSPIPAMASLGKHYLMDKTKAASDARDLGWLLAYELTVLGIDHSYAPVLDLDDDWSEVIGDRSFSKDGEATTKLAREFIKGMAEAGMAATAKHFPGHGSVRADSHLELPVDPRPYQDVLDHDLRPFISLKAEYKALMTAHISFPEIDERPVSFSSEWLQAILREKLEYRGLVISDDLSMKGATLFGDTNDCARLAIEAGCDAILICNARSKAERALEHLEAHSLGLSGRLDVLKSTLNEGQLKANRRKYERIKDQFGY